jgi:C-terminal processing protease CtpA/Prc
VGIDADGLRIAPEAPRYTGPVFVLTSAVNSSATFEFASAMRRAGVGKLIGEPTGGNQRGINGGAFFFLNLPNSRLEIDLPLIGQFPGEPQPDAGLEPDLAVPVTAAGISAGRDEALAAVQAVLAKERKPEAP